MHFDYRCNFISSQAITKENQGLSSFSLPPVASAAYNLLESLTIFCAKEKRYSLAHGSPINLGSILYE